MPTAYVIGIGVLPNGEYEVPEWQLATEVIREAVSDAELSLSELDSVYMPKPRPWTPQGFFSTALAHRLGLDLKRNVEIYTGGTSAASAFRIATTDIRAGNVETALVFAVERNSIIETDDYFEYILELFDQEMEAPIGPTIPGMYAQSLQRYMHDFGVDHETIAEIAVKNRDHACANDDAIFSDTTTINEIFKSRIIADPLHLYECPRPCDGAAALIISADANITASKNPPIEIAGLGYHHPPSHFLGIPRHALSTLPAAARAFKETLSDASLEPDDIDVFEPYAPFPHIEAILTEELGVFDRGEGAAACTQGETSLDGILPVSPSGGCIGRGHPAMVTPLLNYIASVRQLRRTAANQISGASTALTTAEHGHVDGMNATVFQRGD